MRRILGIETSCDETALAVVDAGRIVRGHTVRSQHELHRRYGGVVPEIASRAHLERLVPALESALAEADAPLGSIDAVAVGHRPGLIGSLLVGVSAAKALSWSLKRPLIGVDHIQAHLYAPHLGEPADDAPPAPPAYPALGLVASGGHTSLYDVAGPARMNVLGRTQDDAVGEAYDKAAAILELGYPGGPAVEAAAAEGDPDAVEPLPETLLGRESLDFSFSGLKTALLYRVRGRPEGRGRAARFPHSAAELAPETRNHLAAAFQRSVLRVIETKLRRGLDAMARAGRSPETLVVGGGVCANRALRQRVERLGAEAGVAIRLAPKAYCLDNGAMIGGLAWHRAAAGEADDLELPAVSTT